MELPKWRDFTTTAKLSSSEVMHARTHAHARARTVDDGSSCRSSGPSLSPARIRTPAPLFVPLAGVIKGAHATPRWRDRDGKAHHPGGAPCPNYPHIHLALGADAPTPAGLAGAPLDVHQQCFHITNVASVAAAPSSDTCAFVEDQDESRDSGGNASTRDGPRC